MDRKVPDQTSNQSLVGGSGYIDDDPIGEQPDSPAPWPTVGTDNGCTRVPS